MSQHFPVCQPTQVLGKAVPIRYGSGGTVLAVLVNDVVTLPASSNSSSSSSTSGGSGFAGGVPFMQQLGMATQIQQPNASSDATQPWDGIIVSGLQHCAAGSLQQWLFVCTPEHACLHWLV
jgi:hypothetical protein